MVNWSQLVDIAARQKWDQTQIVDSKCEVKSHNGYIEITIRLEDAGDMIKKALNNKGIDSDC